jgi:uncharacterized protein YozE (UPF0346 family)
MKTLLLTIITTLSFSSFANDKEELFDEISKFDNFKYNIRSFKNSVAQNIMKVNPSVEGTEIAKFLQESFDKYDNYELIKFTTALNSQKEDLAMVRNWYHYSPVAFKMMKRRVSLKEQGEELTQKQFMAFMRDELPKIDMGRRAAILKIMQLTGSVKLSVEIANLVSKVGLEISKKRQGRNLASIATSNMKQYQSVLAEIIFVNYAFAFKNLTNEDFLTYAQFLGRPGSYRFNIARHDSLYRAFKSTLDKAVLNWQPHN